MARLRVKGREDKERPVWLMPETVAVLEAYLAKQPAVEDDALFIAGVVQGVQSPAGSLANRMKSASLVEPLRPRGSAK